LTSRVHCSVLEQRTFQCCETVDFAVYYLIFKSLQELHC
jgi:hypothetical protein